MTREIDREKLYQLYVVEKHSMKEVAGFFGCGVGTIHRHIRRELIEARPTGLNRNGTCWNKGLTYQDDDRILAKEKHPRYIDGRTYESDFHHLKKILLPAKCGLCGKKAILLHHRDKNKKNNKMDNLMPLCASCHSILHNKERDSFINLLLARGFGYKDGKSYRLEHKDRKFFKMK